MTGRATGPREHGSPIGVIIAKMIRWLGACALLAVTAYGGSTTRAFAACQVTIRAPIQATATSISVPWSFGCSPPPSGFSAPSMVQLILGGTSPSYQDGQILGQLTNLGGAQNAGSIQSNLETLTAGKVYQPLRVCATKGAIVCSPFFSATTTPNGPSLGSNPPITGLSYAYDAAHQQLTLSWSPSTAYSSYVAAISDRTDTISTESASVTWSNVRANAQYTLSVEGCVFHGFPAGSTCSGKWASLSAFIKPTPPGPPLAPQNLQVGFQTLPVIGIAVSWNEPSQGSVTESFTRSPAWSARGFQPKVNATGTYRSFVDTDFVQGQAYQYIVCLNGAGGSACATGFASVPQLPPKCQESVTCPAASGVPPGIAIRCNTPADFYESASGGSPSSWSRLPQDSPTSYSGVDQFANPPTVFACRPGSKTICGGYSLFMPATGCGTPPPIPTKPLKSCQACFESNRQCVKVTGGFQCKGLAQ